MFVKRLAQLNVMILGIHAKHRLINNFLVVIQLKTIVTKSQKMLSAIAPALLSYPADINVFKNVMNVKKLAMEIVNKNVEEA